MTILLYVIIVLVATTLGAGVGLGGGVIIKPFFDLINIHSAAAIGVYSAMSVFTMSVVAIYKQYKNKATFDLPIVLSIAIGSMLGGLLGESIFNMVNDTFGSSIKIIQSLLLGLILFIILIYTLKKDQIKTYALNNKIMIFMIGFLLGNISVFLGIGGGPLNLAVLSFFFSFKTRQASVLSIVIIFFSQASKLIKVYLTNQFIPYDMSIVPFILVAAVIGGMLGSMINKNFSEKALDKLYISSLVFLIALSGYNFIMALI